MPIPIIVTDVSYECKGTGCPVWTKQSVWDFRQCVGGECPPREKKKQIETLKLMNLWWGFYFKIPQSHSPAYGCCGEGNKGTIFHYKDHGSVNAPITIFAPSIFVCNFKILTETSTTIGLPTAPRTNVHAPWMTHAWCRVSTI